MECRHTVLSIHMADVRWVVENRNTNISLTKGWAKDTISPLECNSHVERRCMHVGPIVAPISTMTYIK